MNLKEQIAQTCAIVIYLDQKGYVFNGTPQMTKEPSNLFFKDPISVTMKFTFVPKNQSKEFKKWNEGINKDVIETFKKIGIKVTEKDLEKFGWV